MYGQGEAASERGRFTARFHGVPIGLGTLFDDITRPSRRVWTFANAAARRIVKRLPFSRRAQSPCWIARVLLVLVSEGWMTYHRARTPKVGL